MLNIKFTVDSRLVNISIDVSVHLMYTWNRWLISISFKKVFFLNFDIMIFTFTEIDEHMTSYSINYDGLFNHVYFESEKQFVISLY